MTPTNVVGAVQTHQLISTFDIDKPEKRNELFRKYGKQGLGFFNILDTLGYIEKVENTRYSHFEEQFIHETVRVRSNVAAPASGTSIAFTLHTADLDASNRFYIQLNDQVMFANGVTGTVTNINVGTPTAPVVTVETHNHTFNGTNFGLTANDSVVIFSNSWAEGTAQPGGKVSKTKEIYFNTKIMKETDEVTGTEMTVGKWFNVMSDGQSIPAYYRKGQIDTDYRMMLRIDGAMLFDTPTTNTTLIANQQRTTWGLTNWIRTLGNVDTYTAGSFGLADFDTNVKTLDQEFAPSEMLSMLGIDLQIEWENLFVNQFDQGAIVYANFSDGKKATDLNIGFKSFTKSERTWHIKRMDVFNHKKLYGAPGFNASKMGICAPMDKVKDAKSKNHIPSIGQRYQELGGYSRKMEMWTTGGAGNQPKTSQVDKMELNLRTERGSQYIAANRFLLIEV